jgi:hypothetical protein
MVRRTAIGNHIGNLLRLIDDAHISGSREPKQRVVVLVFPLPFRKRLLGLGAEYSAFDVARNVRAGPKSDVVASKSCIYFCISV